MDMTLQQLELEVLQAIGIVAAAGLLYLAQRAAAYFKIQLNATRLAMLDSAVDKVMTLGVAKADDIIREKGWDHVDSKSAVLNFAINTIGGKFNDTLKANGVNLADPSCRVALMDQMERKWADVATRLSLSPATPLTPDAPIAAIATQTPAATA
jgi:hypothetical protein